MSGSWTYSLLMRLRRIVSHELDDPIIEAFEMAWLDRMTLFERIARFVNGEL